MRATERPSPERTRTGRAAWAEADSQTEEDRQCSATTPRAAPQQGLARLHGPDDRNGPGQDGSEKWLEEPVRALAQGDTDRILAWLGRYARAGVGLDVAG
ncbi:hypothetical protein SAMN05444858_1342 [Micromonospora avicenniae]|uniref:Uncharacterized protein n=1 Tax=Micromonospora avicenniae TaxID=1198245 RepID=A0A1N7FCZ1_9ACTN|nr:hypothetical protein SAMN05444858_1342 [Micromonospora avicenniae]